MAGEAEQAEMVEHERGRELACDCRGKQDTHADTRRAERGYRDEEGAVERSS